MSASGIVILLFLAGFGALGYTLYYLVVNRQTAAVKNLMGTSAVSHYKKGAKENVVQQTSQEEEVLEKLKEEARKEFSRRNASELEEKFFKAGIFTEEQKREFNRVRILCLIVGGILGAMLAFQVTDLGMLFSLLALVIGVAVGYRMPNVILDRKIKRRLDDIMYYLPVVIEQVVIGVSSSLDVGPCLQNIVNMADERDSHNEVTELLRIVQYYVKSGISLEKSLEEVGQRSGHTELKHAFMSLAQVARHGGEVTKQLQELAESVAAQREAQIEGKIKRLELVAIAPVGLVFLGFLIILLTTFFMQLTKLFK